MRPLVPKKVGYVSLALQKGTIPGGATAYLGGATAYLVGGSTAYLGGATAYLGGATAYLVGGWEDESKNKTNLSQN